MLQVENGSLPSIDIQRSAVIVPAHVSDLVQKIIDEVAADTGLLQIASLKGAVESRVYLRGYIVAKVLKADASAISQYGVEAIDKVIEGKLPKEAV
ncbi:MAG: hypothetical protein WA194_07020 [Patescibacteria group bacterium]